MRILVRINHRSRQVKPFGYGLHLLDDAFGRADPPVQEAQG